MPKFSRFDSRNRKARKEKVRAQFTHDDPLSHKRYVSLKKQYRELDGSVSVQVHDDSEG